MKIIVIGGTGSSGERRPEDSAEIRQAVVGLFDASVRNMLDEGANLVTVTIAEADSDNAHLAKLKGRAEYAFGVDAGARTGSVKLSKDGA